MLSMSHRVFVVDGHDVMPISRKVFSGFYMGKQPVLPQFGDQTITVAIAYYELKDRRPHRVVQISCTKMRVMPDGRLDDRDYLENMVLAINQPQMKPRMIRAEGNVRDAKNLFIAKKLESRHPPLSGPAHGKILNHLFH